MKEEVEETVHLTNSLKQDGRGIPFLSNLRDWWDVSLITSDKKVVQCQSMLLAAASPMLADILRTACTKDDSIVIVAESMTKNEAELLLELLLNGIAVSYTHLTLPTKA